jgi:hypothetical protein
MLHGAFFQTQTEEHFYPQRVLYERALSAGGSYVVYVLPIGKVKFSKLISMYIQCHFRIVTSPRSLGVLAEMATTHTSKDLI